MAVPTRFLAPRDYFPEYNAVMVGNSGAIWTGAGGLTISCSRHPFRTAYLCFILIEHRYNLHSDRYACAARMNQCFVFFFFFFYLYLTRRDSLRLKISFAGVFWPKCICWVCAQHVQRCSEQASRYNILLSDRTGRLWWVKEQNKDWASVDAMSLNDVQLVYFFFFIMLILSF